MASLRLEYARLDIKIGTEVIRVDDSGHLHLTRTRSEVWDLCGRHVVKVEGIAGGYDIERIFVMPERGAG